MDYTRPTLPFNLVKLFLSEDMASTYEILSEIYEEIEAKIEIIIEKY